MAMIYCRKEKFHRPLGESQNQAEFLKCHQDRDIQNNKAT